MFILYAGDLNPFWFLPMLGVHKSLNPIKNHDKKNLSSVSLLTLLTFLKERDLSASNYLEEQIPVSNITELVVQLMSDAEVELSLRQANYPTALVAATVDPSANPLLSQKPPR